jgi:cyanophycin synthetase
MLYPPKSCRIPIIAVTGTNGKTTTRLFLHIVKIMVLRSDSLLLMGFTFKIMMEKGDTTGPKCRVHFEDPTVEFAVLETARGGILRSGLGFSLCDIGYY